MADPMLIDIDESENKKPEMDNTYRNNSGKKCLKRKRAALVESLTAEEREARISALRQELQNLINCYKELLDEKVNLDFSESGSDKSAIACLLEESNLSLTKLVDEICEKMKAREGSGSAVTVASVKSSVLIIGQRSLYGVANADADVLEDETESCLWCWETRDVKLLPKSVRGALKNRRTWRKKIHERITAVSELITALQEPGNNQNCRYDPVKASERLGKVLSEADIRSLVKSLEQKSGANTAEKEAKREEKQLIKQLERNKREAEKEKKRLDRELQKERLLKEKELKRLHDEAEKEERRREKEKSELRKQLKKQQEEADKDRRRREKEEAILKKQLSLQRQASLMERFIIKRSKNNSTFQNDESSNKATVCDLSPEKGKKLSQSVASVMDCALSTGYDTKVEDIRESHLVSWRSLGHAIRSNREQHWGLRRKPKTEVIKEIKLNTSRGLAHDDELSVDKLVDGCDEIKVEGRSSDTNDDSAVSSSERHSRSKQLLQFDKSYRPAFYGFWPRKSQVIGPRHPLKKDPDLDYDIDSDEEWEEEEPGESLSDCDKDDEEEILEEGYSKVDEDDDSEDGFFVPDGYLSDNEGVQVDKRDSGCLVNEVGNSEGCKQELESDEICGLFRQQKCLQNLTEHALRKSQPLVILNLMHEKAALLTTEELTGTPKLEQMCLQALSMRPFPGMPPIEILIDNNLEEEEQETRTSNSKDCTTPATTDILDSDLPQIVSTIQSCSQGINKLVESLHQKFPSISKSFLRNKVREISDYVDNRWQVKKDILDKLGLSISPEKVSRRRSTIATFFSKRCLPPAANGKSINPVETSPPTQKAAPSVQLQNPHLDHHRRPSLSV